MARRIDFYDDPSAPEANSLVPSVNVVVTNSAGEVLLIRRSDNDNWAVPGGTIDLGESMLQAAVRETREETGIDCEVTGLVGIYTDPRHVMLYTSNGEARQEFSIVLTARATGGEPTRSEESSEVRWVPRVELGGYSMDRSPDDEIDPPGSSQHCRANEGITSTWPSMRRPGPSRDPHRTSRLSRRSTGARSRSGSRSSRAAASTSTWPSWDT
jgi:ADP-ribose pyrophosphatase YjhB (NUDIX family)